MNLLVNRPRRAALVLLLLAVMVFFIHKIIFGFAGAAAMAADLYLFDLLERPVTGAVQWLDEQETSWARGLKPSLDRPTVCYGLSVVAAFGASAAKAEAANRPAISTESSLDIFRFPLFR